MGRGELADASRWWPSLVVLKKGFSMQRASILCAVLSSALVVVGAEPAPDRPAESAGGGRRYPLLHGDGTVTFRVVAREAKQVQVAPRGTGNGLGDKPLEMSRGEG